jgi:hypothetical protein
LIAVAATNFAPPLASRSALAVMFTVVASAAVKSTSEASPVVVRFSVATAAFVERSIELPAAIPSSVKARNNQLNNLRSLLGITNSMGDLIVALEKDQGHNSITSKENKEEADNIIAAAQKLLSRPTGDVVKLKAV